MWVKHGPHTPDLCASKIVGCAVKRVNRCVGSDSVRLGDLVKHFRIDIADSKAVEYFRLRAMSVTSVKVDICLHGVAD